MSFLNALGYLGAFAVTGFLGWQVLKFLGAALDWALDVEGEGE